MDVLGTESSEHLLIHLLNVKSVKKPKNFQDDRDPNSHFQDMKDKPLKVLTSKV